MPQYTQTVPTMPHSRTTQKICPACGGLQCLCRPRFFAGQLLTEEDLNRLEHYMIEKNKLHNRYLHGWGVVCGLEVACHPCQGYVTVKPGYALSPCGDDIIVCNEEVVDVCGLIKQCRDDIRRQWDCEPAWPHTDPECRELSEPWVLYLCYDEKPSRGITALRGSSGAICCSRCSGGGSTHCGCGCHAKTSGTTQTAYRPAARTTALQCEPTVTCEGYTFQIRKAPGTTSQGDLGAMINRISACIRDLVPLSQELQQVHPGSLNTVKVKLRTFLDAHAIQNCELYQKIADLPPRLVEMPHPLLVEFLQECICSALLPPCPEPVEDNCVPLATVTVNCKDGCRIERVCNWEQRRVVITAPNLEYWFQRCYVSRA